MSQVSVSTQRKRKGQGPLLGALAQHFAYASARLLYMLCPRKLEPPQGYLGSETSY